MGKISRDKIDINDSWEGYLWMSNSQNPLVNKDMPRTIDLSPNANPFIVEGELFDNSSKTSYSIRYIDGEYHIYDENVVDVNWLNLVNQKEAVGKKKDSEGNDVAFVVRRIDYFSNRMGGRWLKFLRYWEEKKDENCMNMSVLTFTKNVFVGFKEKENKL